LNFCEFLDHVEIGCGIKKRSKNLFFTLKMSTNLKLIDFQVIQLYSQLNCVLLMTVGIKVLKLHKESESGIVLQFTFLQIIFICKIYRFDRDTITNYKQLIHQIAQIVNNDDIHYSALESLRGKKTQFKRKFDKNKLKFIEH